MAQTMVEKGMKTFPLSEVLHVSVTKQSRVQFTNKPGEKSISETSVNFTIPHWISYVTVGRPIIRNAIREGIQDSLLYHGNSKVAKVLQSNESNTYQIHLMSFNAKDAHKRDLCFYLTENEYEELEKIIPQINECLENAVPQSKETFFTAYQWALVPCEEADMKVCTKYYFLREHAMKQGSEEAYNAEVNVDRIDTITDYIPLPEAINFLKKVYMVMLYRVCWYVKSNT